ncbi:unnamed protein product [Cuscuta campestris]|uniref:WRKY domain-containing protein n=1 Tax=Cuscuta campestris TaxID=132261 RepID=A0A484KQ43_9ASTE|nr:unnamed protein product [Cuscuta campestris]
MAAVELMMDYRRANNSPSLAKKPEESAVVKEAASGLESVEKLIRLLSQRPPENQESSSGEIEMVAGVAVDKFRRVIDLLGRTPTGHARFRRAPVPSTPAKEAAAGDARVYNPTPIQHVLPPACDYTVLDLPPAPRKDSVVSAAAGKSISCFPCSPEISRANSWNISSSLTGEAESKQASSSSAFPVTTLSLGSSAGRPPLSSSCLKRSCSLSENNFTGKCSGSSGRCHCSKKRKLRQKRTIRVPATSLKMSDIPADDFSWRKYGQKPIKGSPHPRGYYKCSSVRGCPARKHVERAPDDPTMLIVTYEDQHNHSPLPPPSHTNSSILDSILDS